MTEPAQFPVGYESGAPNWLRPKSVTVVCIIGICWAVLALLCEGGGYMLQAMSEASGQYAHQPLPVPGIVSTVSVVGSIALAIILLIVCIAALKIVSWAPRIALAYGFMAILFNVAIAIWWMGTFDLSVIKIPPQQPLTPGATTIPAETMKAMTVFMFQAANIGGLILGSVMPIVLLITFGRRSIRDFYTGKLPPSAFAAYPPAPGNLAPPPPGAWPPPPQ